MADSRYGRFETNGHIGRVNICSEKISGALQRHRSEKRDIGTASYRYIPLKYSRTGVHHMKSSKITALDLSASIFPTTVMATDIPLSIVSTQGFDRLVIKVGVNGGKPVQHILDTGSTEFNIEVGNNPPMGGQPWFPYLPGQKFGNRKFSGYGDGTYGYDNAETSATSFQFYDLEII
jgi:hypothetical protein